MVKNMYHIFLGLQATVAAAPMIGYLPGGLIFGTMSDKIGRKPTFLICNAVGIEFYTKTSIHDFMQIRLSFRQQPV